MTMTGDRLIDNRTSADDATTADAAASAAFTSGS
jgi:hypothetical protein